MTVVARFAYKGVPLVIGDLLVTNGLGRQLTRLPVLPSAAVTHLRDNYQLIPTGLYQKIVVAAPNLVIGWTGDCADASILIEDIVTHNRLYPFGFKELCNYLNNHDKLKLDPPSIDIVGMLEEDGIITSFQSSDVRSFWTRHFDDVAVLGTGAEQVATAFSEFDEIPFAEDGQPNHVQAAISAALTTCGGLLCNEVISQVTLRARFGAGYELAGWNGNRFEKFPELTYVFWIARFESNGDVAIHKVPYSICRYAYFGDLLQIKSVVCTQMSSSDVDVTDYFVPQVHRLPTAEEISAAPQLDFDCQAVCHFFIVQTSDLAWRVLSRHQYGVPDDDRWIVVEMTRDANLVHVRVRHDFLRTSAIEIGQKLKRRLFQ